MRTVRDARRPVARSRARCGTARGARTRCRMPRGLPDRFRRADAALRRHDLRQRVPAVPRPADHREADPAVVRRLGRGVDDVPRVLPERAARGLRVLRTWTVRRFAPRTQVLLHIALLAAEPRSRAADRSRRALEARRQREPVVADPRPARRDDRPAVFPAVDDEPAGAGVVRARASRAQVRTACSRCRISRRCWRCSAIRSCSSRGSPTRAQALGWSAGYALFVVLCAPRAATSVRGVRARRRSRRCAGAGAVTATGVPATSRRRRRAAGAVVRARRDRLAAAARRVEPHHAEHRVGAAAVDRAARDLPADVHPLLRRRRLVPARHLPRDARRGARRDGVDAGRPEPHARARAPDRRVLRRPVPRLHVLPRRARAAEARAALPDALLPDDLARRRAAARCWSASSRRSCCPRTSSSPAASSLCALLLAVAGPPRARRVRRAGRRRRCSSTVGCGVWSVREFYDDTIVATRNFYGVLRVQEYGRDEVEPSALADPRHDPARQAVPRAGSQAQPTSYYTPTSGIGRLLESLHPRTRSAARSA